MGLELYRYGGLPYIGSWDHNFPGTVLVHATDIALFGNSMIGFRAFELILQIMIVLSLYGLSRLWLSRGPSLIACGLYALFYVHGPVQFMGQRDAFAVLPLAIAFWATIAAYRSRSEPTRMLLFASSGVLFALATSVRPTFAILPIIPFITLYDLRAPAGRKLFACEILGFLVVVIAWVIPYALTPDGIHQVYLSAFRFNFEVYSHAPFHFHDISNRTLLVLAFLLWWAAMMVLHRRSGKRFTEAPKSKPEQRFMIASQSGLLLGVIVMHRFASYHLLPFCAFFMPLLGAAIWDLKLRWGKAGSIGMTAFLAILVAAIYPWKVVFGKDSQAIIFGSGPMSTRLKGEPLNEAVVAYIKKNTRENDVAEVSAFFPDIRWEIDRRSATRFTTLTAILLHPDHRSYTDFQRVWQSEYVSSMEQNRPKYYVVLNAVDSSDNIFTLRDLMALPGLSSFVSRNYILDTTMGLYYIYKRNDNGASTIN